VLAVLLPAARCSCTEGPTPSRFNLVPASDPIAASAERGGDRCRFSEGDIRGVDTWICMPKAAAQYDLCGLPDRKCRCLPSARFSISGLHHESGGHRVSPVDAIVDEASPLTTSTGVRTDLNHIVSGSPIQTMMKDCVPDPLQPTSMETMRPESRRCLRRIFFLRATPVTPEEKERIHPHESIDPVQTTIRREIANDRIRSHNLR